MLVTRRELLGGAIMAGGLALAPWARALPAGRIFRCPVTVEPNRLVIEAVVAGRGVRLLIDTGAPWSLIDNDLAKAMRLIELPGRHVIVGIGGVSDYPWYDAGEVRFGQDIRLPHMLFVGARAGFGPQLVGTFGSGLFTSFDSDLDLSKGEWRSYPDGRGDFEGLQHIPSRFRGGQEQFGEKIMLDATIGGFAGEFTLDTGMPGDASLEGRASAKSGLWNDTRPYVPVQSHGLGKGKVPGRLVRVDRMNMGPFTCQKPLVTLDRPGENSSMEGDGIIGLGALRQLNLTTRVATHSVWGMPSGLPRRPDRYGMSGLWVDGEGNNLTIADVGTGSPAAGAGVRVGDKVVGIEFSALLRQITGAPGTHVALTIERAGKRQDVAFVLTPYL